MGITCSNFLNISIETEYKYDQCSHELDELKSDNNYMQNAKQVFHCELWHYYNLKWFKKDVEIEMMTHENQSLQNVIIKKKRDYNLVGLENFTNLEQLHHLNWSGKYGQFNQKVGKWITTWKGEILRDVKGWYYEGKKQGQWRQILKNYRIKAYTQESGYYQDDQRQGSWKYIYEDQLIDGGYYNCQGKKNGKWTQLSDRFCQYSQIRYAGEYKNGLKVGIWDILYQKEYQYKDIYIGGGLYDENGTKFGVWIEESENFQHDSQVTYIGQYQNGKKIGRWDIWFNKSVENVKELIGGGLYDENGTKFGVWSEMSENFQDYSQVTYIGQYSNSKKVGRWDSFLKEKSYNRHILIKANQLFIGGGSYDEVKSIKIGRWIELSDSFAYQWQITYNGEYKNGKKIGRWDTQKRDDGYPFTQIGNDILVVVESMIQKRFNKNWRVDRVE